jgi:hypothetical protein
VFYPLLLRISSIYHKVWDCWLFLRWSGQYIIYNHIWGDYWLKNGRQHNDQAKKDKTLSFPHSWLITRFVTRLTRRVPLVNQELPTLPENVSSPLVFCGVRVTRSLVLCVYFVDRCLSFSFGHCVVCSSSIYEFWLPVASHWQTLSHNVVSSISRNEQD